MQELNGLLSLLPDDDFSAIRPHLEIIDLPQGLVMSAPGEGFDYCYFPFSGVVSTVVVSPSGKRSEIGILGREGMSPASLALGAEDNPYLVIMQVPGQGARVPVAKMRRVLEASPGVKRLLLRWAHVAFSQTSFTALSNAIHPVDVRLARWILMCHDRVDGDEIDLTHEFLAIMLSVRRPSVTVSLHVLEGKQFIQSNRGTIIVRNRAALERFAADAYGGTEREYKRLFGKAGEVQLSHA
jgi:CRP-like cAMP-binding protein